MTRNIHEILKEGIIANYKGEQQFPDWLKVLTSLGIGRYYADLVMAKITYYGEDGQAYTDNLPHAKAPASGMEFSEKAIQEALSAVQMGMISYPEFLNRVIKAGVINYTVFIEGWKCHYVGSKGEIYIESLPGESRVG